jgi:hypothetical protein
MAQKPISSTLAKIICAVGIAASGITGFVVLFWYVVMDKPLAGFFLMSLIVFAGLFFSYIVGRGVDAFLEHDVNKK